MKREIEIITGAYDKPYRTTAIISESPTKLGIKWKEHHEGDATETVYYIDMNKERGTALIKRSGEISSELVFDTGAETKGVFNTAYGQIEVDIETEYINMPSLLTNRFEISYKIVNGKELQKNIFAVRLL